MFIGKVDLRGAITADAYFEQRLECTRERMGLGYHTVVMPEYKGLKLPKNEGYGDNKLIFLTFKTLQEV